MGSCQLGSTHPEARGLGVLVKQPRLRKALLRAGMVKNSEFVLVCYVVLKVAFCGLLIVLVFQLCSVFDRERGSEVREGERERGEGEEGGRFP